MGSSRSFTLLLAGSHCPLRSCRSCRFRCPRRRCDRLNCLEPSSGSDWLPLSSPSLLSSSLDSLSLLELLELLESPLNAPPESSLLSSPPGDPEDLTRADRRAVLRRRCSPSSSESSLPLSCHLGRLVRSEVRRLDSSRVRWRSDWGSSCPASLGSWCRRVTIARNSPIVAAIASTVDCETVLSCSGAPSSSASSRAYLIALSAA